VGIHVVLMRVTQRGTSSKGRKLTRVRELRDRTDALEPMLIRVYGNGRTPTLDRVAPTNRTFYLQHNEVDLLVADLAAVRAFVRSPAESDILDGVLALARECAAADDLLLAFEAD
jgi:hypothetical protein